MSAPLHPDVRNDVGALQRAHAGLTGLPGRETGRAIRRGGLPSRHAVRASAPTIPAARDVRGKGLRGP
jgi:hypothetical protein